MPKADLRTVRRVLSTDIFVYSLNHTIPYCHVKYFPEHTYRRWNLDKETNTLTHTSIDSNDTNRHIFGVW